MRAVELTGLTDADRRQAPHSPARNSPFALTRHGHSLGLELDSNDFTVAQAVAAVARITCGNFPLLQRLPQESANSSRCDAHTERL